MTNRRVHNVGPAPQVALFKQNHMMTLKGLTQMLSAAGSLFAFVFWAQLFSSKPIWILLFNWRSISSAAAGGLYSIQVQTMRLEKKCDSHSTFGSLGGRKRERENQLTNYKWPPFLNKLGCTFGLTWIFSNCMGTRARALITMLPSFHPSYVCVCFFSHLDQSENQN